MTQLAVCMPSLHLLFRSHLKNEYRTVSDKASHCHSERSEESVRDGIFLGEQILRFAQNDNGNGSSYSKTTCHFDMSSRIVLYNHPLSPTVLLVKTITM